MNEPDSLQSINDSALFGSGSYTNPYSPLPCNAQLSSTGQHSSVDCDEHIAAELQHDEWSAEGLPSDALFLPNGQEGTARPEPNQKMDMGVHLPQMDNKTGVPCNEEDMRHDLPQPAVLSNPPSLNYYDLGRNNLPFSNEKGSKGQDLTQQDPWMIAADATHSGQDVSQRNETQPDLPPRYKNHADHYVENYENDWNRLDQLDKNLNNGREKENRPPLGPQHQPDFPLNNTRLQQQHLKKENISAPGRQAPFAQAVYEPNLNIIVGENAPDPHAHGFEFPMQDLGQVKRLDKLSIARSNSGVDSQEEGNIGGLPFNVVSSEKQDLSATGTQNNLAAEEVPTGVYSDRKGDNSNLKLKNSSNFQETRNQSRIQNQGINKGTKVQRDMRKVPNSGKNIQVHNDCGNIWPAEMSENTEDRHPVGHGTTVDYEQQKHLQQQLQDVQRRSHENWLSKQGKKVSNLDQQREIIQPGQQIKSKNEVVDHGESGEGATGWIKSESDSEHLSVRSDAVSRSHAEPCSFDNEIIGGADQNPYQWHNIDPNESLFNEETSAKQLNCEVTYFGGDAVSVRSISEDDPVFDNQHEDSQEHNDEAIAQHVQMQDEESSIETDANIARILQSDNESRHIENDHQITRCVQGDEAEHASHHSSIALEGAVGFSPQDPQVDLHDLETDFHDVHVEHPTDADEKLARQLQEQLLIEDTRRDEEYARQLQESEERRSINRRQRHQRLSSGSSPLRSRLSRMRGYDAPGTSTPRRREYNPFGVPPHSHMRGYDNMPLDQNVADSRVVTNTGSGNTFHRGQPVPRSPISGSNGSNYDSPFNSNLRLWRQREEGYDIPPDPSLFRDEYEPNDLSSYGTYSDDELVSMTRDSALLQTILMGRAPNMMVPDDVDLDDYEALWDLAERQGEVRRCGMEEQEISVLPVHNFQRGANAAADNSDCSICLNGFSDGEKLRTLPCLHMYHVACIDQWLKRNAVCPVCRQSVHGPS